MGMIIPDRTKDNEVALSTKPSIIPFPIQVNLGKIDGYTIKTVFGNNPAVKTTMETICQSGSVINFNFTAGQVSIASDNDLDKPSSTGAHTLLLRGLDANCDEIIEQINLNGTTAVTTTQSFLRINEARVIVAGSNNKNYGNIGGNVSGHGVFYLPEGKNVTQSVAYTVPAGKTAYIKSGFFSGSNGVKGVEMRFIVVAPNGLETIEQVFYMTASYTSLKLETLFPIPEKYAVKLDAKNLNSGTIEMTAGLEIILKDNEW